MAEYTHDEQVEIVRQALSLETAIKVEQAHEDVLGVMELQGVQVRGLQNLEQRNRKMTTCCESIPVA